MIYELNIYLFFQKEGGGGYWKGALVRRDTGICMVSQDKCLAGVNGKTSNEHWAAQILMSSLPKSLQ